MRSPSRELNERAREQEASGGKGGSNTHSGVIALAKLHHTLLIEPSESEGMRADGLSRARERERELRLYAV